MENKNKLNKELRQLANLLEERDFDFERTRLATVNFYNFCGDIWFDSQIIKAPISIELIEY